MSKQKIIGIVLASSLLLAFSTLNLQAKKKKPWTTSSPAQWGEEELREFLTKSPWAHTKKLRLRAECEGKEPFNRMDLDVGGLPRGFAKYKLTVVWAANIVDTAMDRVTQLLMGGDLQDRSKVAERTALQIYLQAPVSLPCLIPEGETEGFAGTYLKTKSGKRYEPSNIIFPPGYGQKAFVIFEFPLVDESGKSTLTLRDREVEFSTRVIEVQLKVKFKLKDMMVKKALIL